MKTLEINRLLIIATTIITFVGSQTLPAAPLLTIPAKTGKLVTEEELLGPLQKNKGGGEVGEFVPGTHKLLIVSTDPGRAAQIGLLDVDTGRTQTICEGRSPLFSPDGKKVAFEVSAQPAGSTNEEWQIWMCNADGTDRHQITRLEGGIDVPTGGAVGDCWSPDSANIVFTRLIMGTKNSKATAKPEEKSGPTSQEYGGKEIDPNQWSVEIHVLNVASGEDRILTKTTFEQCMSVVWDAAHDAIIASVADGETGKTRNMIARLVSISLRDGQIQTITPPVHDQAKHFPKLSPDGKKLAYRANLFDTFYPYAPVLKVYDFETKKITTIDNHDRRFGMGTWGPSGSSIYYADFGAFQSMIWKVNASTGESTPIPEANAHGLAFGLKISSDGQLMAWVTIENATGARELHLSKLDGSESRVIKRLSDPLAEYATGEIQEVAWKSKDGLEIGGFVVLPLNYEQGKQYPLLVDIHGGPGQAGLGAEGPFLFKSPLEFHYWAARGYAVFHPDYRSSGNYGESQFLKMRKENDELEKNFEDVMSGVDAVIAKGFVDTNRLALDGHSNGSHVMDYIIEHTHRFQTAASYEGYDMFMDYANKTGANSALEWATGNQEDPLKNLGAFEKESVVFHADGVTTPTMFINCENGINSPSLPWMSAALRRQGVDSQFIYYKGEDHCVEHLENQKDLLNRVTKWVDGHLDYNPEKPVPALNKY